MKVLMIVNWYTLSTEQIMAAGVFHNEQSKELLKYCDDVRLYWPLDTEVDAYSEGFEWGLYTYRSRYDVSNKVVSFVKGVSRLVHICNKYKPDILHAHCSYPAGLMTVIAGKKLGIPVVLTEHSPIEQMRMNNPLYKKIREYVYSHTDQNVCVSIDSMNRLKHYFPDSSFHLIYNAVINPENLKKTGIQYRRDGAYNCGIVAAFYDKYVKGYQYLLPAIKRVREMGVSIVLHICGGGTYEKYYKQLAKKMNISDACIFYGQQGREVVYSIVSQMDFCVSSSIYECSGVSVQEEMLLGKPVLVTKSGGADSLTKNYTSIVVERESVDALANGLLEMTQKYKEFNSYRIYKYAYKNFVIENVTQKYMELYRKNVK